MKYSRPIGHNNENTTGHNSSILIFESSNSFVTEKVTYECGWK